MRLLIQQYGRVILITVIFIMFFLWLPFITKQLGRAQEAHSNEQVDNLTMEVVFYVDGEKFVTEKGMSWEQWVVSDYNKRENGTRYFSIWEDPCREDMRYKVGNVKLTTIE